MSFRSSLFGPQRNRASAFRTISYGTKVSSKVTDVQTVSCGEARAGTWLFKSFLYSGCLKNGLVLLHDVL